MGSGISYIPESQLSEHGNISIHLCQIQDKKTVRKNKNLGQAIMKIIGENATKDEAKDFTRECLLLKQCDHAQIVKFIDYFADKNKIVLVMEKADCDL